MAYVSILSIHRGLAGWYKIRLPQQEQSQQEQ